MEKSGIQARFLASIEQILDQNPDLTKTKLAEVLGCGRTKLSEIMANRMMAGTDVISKLCTEYYISPAWLLTGEGEMLKQAAPAEPIAVPPTDTVSRRRIPLYADIASIGGLNDKIAEVENSTTRVAEWIDAGDWFPEATAAIRHYGDSMVEYPAGSILVLKRVQDTRLLLNGRNYVIETTEYRITKQLQYDAGNDYLIAYSTNRETYPDGRLVHSPIRIPLETIRHIDLIVGCVQKEFSNGAIPII